MRYVTDELPGIEREKFRKGFRYRYATGNIVRENEVLNRIRALAVPPAWTNVWISPDPSGHLQATGRDARGRKQNRYHRDWREVRDETKYSRMTSFARVLPKIRARVEEDLLSSGLGREKVLATVVRLLETSLIRVGNEEYARENKSFGLTTMRNHHVDVNRGTLIFHFRGKGGKWHEVSIHDARLAKVIRNCQELPGQELFQYVDEHGQRHKVSSEDVNNYLRQVSGQDFTAKDFRTWAGTVLCAVALDACGPFKSEAQAKGNIAKAIEAAAKLLGNTATICRKCYVHPELITRYLNGVAGGFQMKPARKSLRRIKGLRREEAALLRVLRLRVSSNGGGRFCKAVGR